MNSPNPILAFGGRRNNAEAIRDCAVLDYLPGPVLDPTYGSGRFWNLLRPVDLIASDRNPACGVLVADFTALPFADGSFATVVFDPPYKANGTSTGKGCASSDAGYGVAVYRSKSARMELILAGVSECARVASRFVLVKCQDQRDEEQTRPIKNHADTCGLRFRDDLHVPGHRKQPPDGGRQRHVWRDYSTLLVFKVRPTSRRGAQ
jgi:hypothetical protein